MVALLDDGLRPIVRLLCVIDAAELYPYVDLQQIVKGRVNVKETGRYPSTYDAL